jgi:aspartate aminotransferase
MERLVFGDAHPTLKAGRIRTIQAPGGCGALRVGAELIRLAMPEAVVHVSTPTWANHVPLLTGAGIKLERYAYYDGPTGGVNFSAMLEALERLPARSVVLLHGSCHNPTGADLSEGQWREVLALVSRRGLIPYIDMAYQGLGSGVAEDAFGARLFAAELPEVIVAVSCSKNFGLYRERTGALHIINQTPAAADAVLSQLVRIARTIYSMPPDHGAAIVHEILANDGLRGSWLDELGSMRTRIAGLRKDLVGRLAKAAPGREFSFIERQKGMFSYLGVTTEQVRALRERHHVYMTDDSRMNVAGLRAENIGYFADSVAQVLSTSA